MRKKYDFSLNVLQAAIAAYLQFGGTHKVYLTT